MAHDLLDRFLFLLENNLDNINVFETLSLKNYTCEEYRNLQEFWICKKNQDLFFLDKKLKKKVLSFKKELDNTKSNFESIKRVLEKRGTEILSYSKLKIQEKNKPYSNKDGLLYLARLCMQVILKNHKKVANFCGDDIQALSDIFEKNSRGLVGKQKPKFPKKTSNKFNILISGYDPFSNGLDWESHISNPSGNLALALDERVIVSKNNTKLALIKSVIFPVRYKEFDEGWINDFFTPYVTDDNIKMIITFSYGFKGMNADNSYFQLDRFASRLRGQESYSNDNNLINAVDTTLHYPINTNQNEYEFIENSLGNGECNNDYSLWISEEDNFFLSQKFMAQVEGADENLNLLPMKKITEERVDEFYKIKTERPCQKNKNFENLYVNDRKITAIKGSGGDYLSNEIHYTVSFIRKNIKKQTGHIHVGFLQSNKDGCLPNNREIMLKTITKILSKVIDTF